MIPFHLRRIALGLFVIVGFYLLAVCAPLVVVVALLLLAAWCIGELVLAMRP